MGCLLLLVLLVLIFGAGTILTVGIIGLILTLVVAGLVGWAADVLIPGGTLPGGWIGAVLTGLVGGLVGGWLFHLIGIRDPGFDLFGVHLIPALVGALIVALAAQLFTSRRPLV
jgi:uncharacterized membrane protein YeaQ/YmgE (transglycosylase-associated protein family)